MHVAQTSRMAADFLRMSQSSPPLVRLAAGAALVGVLLHYAARARASIQVHASVEQLGELQLLVDQMRCQLADNQTTVRHMQSMLAEQQSFLLNLSDKMASEHGDVR